MTKRISPPALPHGDLVALFPDVFFVTGTIALPGPIPLTFSRNMTVVREGDALTIINSIRLDERGLASLDKLGKVTHVLRIAGFHGMDDPFYKERYGAKVWALKGHEYVAGLSSRKGAAAPYFTPDVSFDETSQLPIAGARLFLFSTRPAEGLVLLDRDGGILVAGDCLQNFQTTDSYFNFPAKVAMRLMGFIKPFSLGPAWMKAVKPLTAEVKSLLDLPFEHLLPAHGSPVIHNAKSAYRPAIAALVDR